MVFVVLEELIMQIGSLDYDNSEELDSESKSVVAWDLPHQTRCEALGAQCDSQGRFTPAQCDQDTCWCVDEAGNQLPHTNTFKKGEHLCCKY